VKIYKNSDKLSVVSPFFKGKIIQMIDEMENIRVTVDIGIPLDILLNKDKLKDIRVCIGDVVKVSFSEDSILFI